MDLIGSASDLRFPQASHGHQFGLQRAAVVRGTLAQPLRECVRHVLDRQIDYLWLASHLQAPRVTFDARLGAVALKHLAGEDPPQPG